MTFELPLKPLSFLAVLLPVLVCVGSSEEFAYLHAVAGPSRPGGLVDRMVKAGAKKDA